MPALPEPLQLLTASLAALPGIGPRSAERIALHIVQAESNFAKELASRILEARQRITFCQSCGALTSAQPCTICRDPRRDSTICCVVEKAVDVLSFEKAGSFRGRFHVLGGRISPSNGIGAEDLNIRSLQERIGAEGIQELILALASDVEGDATSYFLADLFGNKGVKVSRIAQGLPVGSSLEFADQLTLSRALEGRRELPGR